MNRLEEAVAAKMVAERIENFTESELARTLGGCCSRTMVMACAVAMINNGLTIDSLYAAFGHKTIN